MPDSNHNVEELSARLAVGVVGGVLLAQESKRRGALARLVGLGLVLGAAEPLLRRWLVRQGSARRRVRLRTTVEIARPVQEVFSFCKDFENFPRIIGSLRSVIDYQDGRSHWQGYTPSGDIVEWDVVVTKYVPNSVIAWSSVPQSDVTTTGVLRFAATPAGGTRLAIELTYVPADTGLSDALHAIATQPRQEQIRADIERAAFYIESLPSLDVEARPYLEPTHTAVAANSRPALRR